MKEPTPSGRENRGNDLRTDGSSPEDRRETLPPFLKRAMDNNNEAARQRTELLSTMNQTYRAFAETMRATSAERKRFTQERERLLESERAARAEAEASRERLRESEARLQLALEIGRLLPYDWEPASGVFRWDAHLKVLWGLPASAEVDYDAFLSGVHQEDREYVEVRLNRAIDPRGEGIFEAEFRVVGIEDGIERWIASRGQTFFDGDSPVRLTGVAQDITERKRAEEASRRAAELDAFRVELNDALRPLTDPLEIQRTATRVVGTRIAADRVLYAEIGDNSETITIADNYVRGDTPKMVGQFSVSDYGTAAEVLRAGQTFIIPDVERDEGLPVAEREALLALGNVSIIAVPLVKNGRWVSNLGVYHGEPRVWTADEVQFLREAAERTWASVERARTEEALRESEERFRQFAENSQDVLWILETDTLRLEYLSPAYERIWGESRGAVLDDLERWGELVHPEDRERAGEGMSRLLAGETFAQEYRIVRPEDGEERWILDTGFPITDEAGRVRRVGGVAQDITERKRVEEERERLAGEVASERARFEAVLQQMPAGVFIADLDKEFILSNEEATRIYGRPIRSVEECSQYTFSYPGGTKNSPEHSTFARSLRRGDIISGTEFYVRRDDGTTSIISANSAPVRDEEGHIVAVVKAFEDVTWRKEAEVALRESEERLRTVVEGAPVVVFALDRAGIFTTSTGRGLESLGLKPGEVVGQSVYDAYAHVPEILEDIRLALGGDTFTANRQVDGVEFEITYSPSRDAEGEVVGVIGVANDVTERRKAREERERSLLRERASRAQTEERRRISRDLHDRVAHSIGVAHQSLELHEALKERNPEAARTKLELARRMIRESLDSTRNLSVELRRPEVRRSLEAALADLLRDVIPEEIDSSLSVKGDETSILPETRDQLFLILREAVRNAVRHSGCDRLAVELEVTPLMAVGCVEDNGRGLESNGAPPQRRSGLKSMEERAFLVGGTLEVSSARGEGTKIKVSIPLESLKEA